MSLLELGSRKFTIPVGEVTLGSDAGCAIALSGPGVLARHALFQGQADGQVIIRKAAPAAEGLINGVRLGAEPTPLLHGDKVEVGEHELTFVDERRSGSTQDVQVLAPQPGDGPAQTGTEPAAMRTRGGRRIARRRRRPRPQPRERRVPRARTGSSIRSTAWKRSSCPQAPGGAGARSRASWCGPARSSASGWWCALPSSTSGGPTTTT